MLRELIGDKPWFNSFTMIAIVVLTAGESYGLSELPFSDVVAHITRTLTVVFGLAGGRRAQQKSIDTAEAALDAVLVGDEEDWEE